jgi:rubrerythrin
MHELPEGCPDTLAGAFAYINAPGAPTLDMLKVMVLAEAAGKGLYENMALGTDNPDVQALLRRNGREELAHAHRVAQAIGKITGGDPYPVPEPDENPYLAAPMPPTAVTREALLKLAQSEVAGDALYANWAEHTGNAEAAALFRQNGREEVQHGDRLHEAAGLLVAD